MEADAYPWKTTDHSSVPHRQHDATRGLGQGLPAPRARRENLPALDCLLGCNLVQVGNLPQAAGGRGAIGGNNVGN
eukprot:1376376-Prorocentrum_lima.AAC.1